MVKKIRRQDEDEGAADEARGRLEETADTPRDNEKVEGRPERDRRAVDEKKAASPGPSGA